MADAGLCGTVRRAKSHSGQGWEVAGYFGFGTQERGALGTPDAEERFRGGYKSHHVQPRRLQHRSRAEGLQDLPRYLGSHPAGHLVWPRWYAEKETRSKTLCSRLHLWHLTAVGHICTEFVGSQLWVFFGVFFFSPWPTAERGWKGALCRPTSNRCPGAHAVRQN